MKLCCCVQDEFYSGYNYTSDCDGSVISAASNIENVDQDDVLIIDGLTKRFRLPGWRISWILGPKEFIKAIGSCGSYLDGGAAHPFQLAQPWHMRCPTAFAFGGKSCPVWQ